MARDSTFADEEVAGYLERLPRHLTYSQMAEACERRFGERRAWSRSKIADFWSSAHPPRKGSSSRIDLDTELRDFIEDRLGRFSITALESACRERFGAERSPSWSAIQRYWKRTRNAA